MIGHEIITASAGAGKTWSLTLRYIRLLAMGAAPGSIIALTFSRKAAREFFTAILHRLAEAAQDDNAAAKLAQQAQMPALKRSDFVRLLAALVSEMPVLTLGTMDSFFIRMARSFPLELGLTGDFAILDEHRRSMEQERVLSRLFAPSQMNDAGRREFLRAFQQATWGKDEVRLKRLLGEFLKDWQKYYLEAPREDVWGQPATIWPDGRRLPDPDKPMSALISEARRAMGRVDALKESQRETLEAFFTGLETHTPGTPPGTQWKLLLGKLLDALPDLASGKVVLVISRTKATLPPSFAERLHALVWRFVQDTITVCLHQTSGIHRILSLYDRQYHDMVRRQGRLTFQDVQLILSGDIAPEARGADALTAKRGIESASRQSIDYRLDARYDHWLLDEFQDTSRGQWRVLQNLCDEAIQDSEGTRSFFAVGDEKQSIFTWRGAEPGLLSDILAFYNGGGEVRIKETPLALSQRSGPAVISMVNRLTGNLDHLTKLERIAAAAKLWPWQEHASANLDRTGCGAVIEVPVRKDHGESADEALWEACADLLRKLQPLRRGLTCAVICHRNARAAEIADVLRNRSGMEVVCESDVSIATDNPATSAMLSLLKAAAHPADRYSWEHVLMSPLADVIAKRWPDAEGRTLHDRATARRGIFTISVLRQITVQGFARTLRLWRAALLTELPALDSFSHGRLDDLCLAAQDFDASGSRDVDEFIAFAESWRVRESAHANAVQVMTLHKSKGLTFDIVILPDFHDPHMYLHRYRIGTGRDEQREIRWISTLPSKDIAIADPVLRAALEDTETGLWRERLAQLYVSITRARRANYILLPPPPAKESDSISLPRIVRHMLVEGEATPLSLGPRDCEVISLDGDLRWIDAVPFKVPPASVKPKQADLFEGLMASPAPREPAAAAPEVRRARPSARRSHAFALQRQRRRTGTFVHTLFSRVEWAGSDTPALLTKFFNSICPRPEAWQTAALRSVLQCLSNPDASRAFARPSVSALVWRERPFEAVIDGECISGVFDRVIIEHDTAGTPVSAHLIEYKTDQLKDTPAAIGSAAARHVRQTALYRAALAKLTGLPASAVTASLLFTSLTRLIACD
ncbi:MAG TPA: UvrD-helicase domain-containing protein [Verrucomicrobiales bacterium]|nr:UvrD-helicase domain-containing protein [Verrucomicrobiales bacterium]